MRRSARSGASPAHPVSVALRRTVIAAALVVATVLIAGRTLPIDAWVVQFARAIEGLGPWAPVLFGMCYAVALIFCLPGAPFSVGAGLVWGMAGLPVTLAGATLGACGCFFVSRHLLSRWVRPLIAARPKLAALDQAVADEGWRIVLLLRLNPLLPFNVQNYTFGATRIGFWPYAAATAVGIVPGTALHVYFGVLGRDAAGVGQAGVEQAGHGLWRWGVLAAGLVMTALASAVVGRKVRAVLARSSSDSS